MRIYKNDFEVETLEIAESLLFNGNGHIGVRNTLEESSYKHFTSNRHTYINGFSDTYPINYPEQYFGSSNVGEQMLPVIDGSLTKIIIGETEVNLDNGTYTNHSRYLDMDTGQTVREYTFTDNQSNSTKVIIRRITSFVNKEQLITKYSFEKLNHDLDITVKTFINFEIDQNVDKNDPRVAHNKFKFNIDSVDLETNQIKFSSINSKQSGFFSFDITTIDIITESQNGLWIISSVETEYVKAYSYSLTEFVSPISNFDLLAEEQEQYLTDFWSKAKVTIKADDDLEPSVNYGTFALLQSVGAKSIAAKGLSGIGYEGHVFWDAEMYVFPVFNRTMPSVAREMLMFRIEMLDMAIKNRENVGYPAGALYPWRTITGLESSSFFEAGMAQHHINVDISYALSKYIEQTGDYSILDDGGFAMISEIAKMFASLMYKRDGEYHLDMVTGPDEYSALVNDNYYSNGLVKKHFENILVYNDFVEVGRLDSDTIKLYTDIAENMCLPFDNELNIAKQDRDFLNKDKWPYEVIGDKPLILKYHPVEIYRHQVSKKADVVLAMQLFGEEQLTTEQIENTINYYEQVTTHDSSLSFSNFATVYARLGHELGYEYFLKNATLDLENLHHNTKDGIHTASMGGTYQTLVDGFSNYKIARGEISVENKLPKQIQFLQYNVEFEGAVYQITIEGSGDPVIKKMEK